MKNDERRTKNENTGWPPGHRSSFLALRSSILLLRLAEVAAEPADCAGQEVLGVGGRAATQEEVRAAGIADELGLDAGVEEGDEELLALADRAAVILLAVDDQGRGGGAVGEGGGGVGGVPLLILVGPRAELGAAEGVADVAGAVERFEVEA